MSFGSSVIAIVLGSFFSGICIALLVVRGSSLKVEGISIFGVQMSGKIFEQLSPVQLFNHLSRMVPTTISISTLSDDFDPHAMLDMSWRMVSDAYIQRFRQYPDDNSLSKNASELGTQNIEFIRIYRQAYIACLKQAEVPKDFAENFLARAPNLAYRIGGEAALELPDVRRFASQLDKN
ncbi:MAG: hypothetical protein AAFR71_06725 [Pseudomonadota bacterium]